MRRPTIKEREQAEARARASIEARYGHPLTNDEWQEAKSNLRKLFGILAQWQASTVDTTSSAERPKRSYTMPRRNPVHDDFFAALRVQEQIPRWEVLQLEHYVVHVLILPDDAGSLLQEGRWEELNNRYKVRFDRAHPGGKDHYHVAKVNSRGDLFAINADGTGSHGSTGRVIPKEIATALTKKYRDKIRIPPNNVIEELPASAATALFG